jgi:hypothetical protein
MSYVNGSFRAAHTSENIHELLVLRPSALLGVTQQAEAELAELGIRNVFDLGSSHVFANARFAAQASGAGTITQQVRLFPSDLLRPEAAWATLDDIGRLPVDVLREVERPEQLKQALDVETISDLASWPPYVAARKLVGEVVGATIDLEEQEADKLRPRLGDYPTERVYYSTLVLLQADEVANAAPLVSPIPITPLASPDVGFGKPAVGALLTLSQSWYAQGVTLGHLLHSLALAPGESTRIAVIDWARRSRAVATEDVGEAEVLDVAAEHARAVSEVQGAVARELQAGGSTSSVDASSSSTSSGDAGGTGLLLSLFWDYGSSDTTQSSESSVNAASTSWSVGSRSILAGLAQTVNDRTEQHAASVRNRRASAVREVSQSEHQQVSTRIVANYNHMHALTIQYFEVVQIFRVEAELHRVDRCLFIPLRLCQFEGQAGLDVVQRFRWALIRAALSGRALQLLLDDVALGGDVTTVALRAETGALAKPARNVVMQRMQATVRPRRVAARTAAGGTARGAGRSDTPASTSKPAAAAAPATTAWDADAIARMSRLFQKPIIRVDSDDPHVPADVELLALSFDGVSIKEAKIACAGGPIALKIDPAAGYAPLPRSVRFQDLEAISLAQEGQNPDTGSLELRCRYLGTEFSLPPIAIALGSQAMQRVLTFSNNRQALQKELLAHLQANRSHYSTAIYRSLDATAITMLISQYQWKGKPLIDQVEPKPVAVIGNYVVLRAPIEVDETSGVSDGERVLSWGDLLDRRQIKLGSQDERLVPIPSNGIFAEAVLGRSNSAEKLDITRFWNWQDSPIPLEPPEIAAVDTSSRAEPEDLKPGALGQPVLSIVNPTNLPDPTSLAAIMTAVASGSMFRDMSGLAGTQQLAQAGMSGTLAAATQAGDLASANLRTHAQKAVAMGQIAADIVKSIFGKGGGGSSSRNISADGARINHGRDMDARGISGSSKVLGAARPAFPGNGISSPSGGTTTARMSRAADGEDGGARGFSREVAYADSAGLGTSIEAVDAVTASTYRPAVYSPEAGGVESVEAAFTDTSAEQTARAQDPQVAMLVRASKRELGELTPDYLVLLTDAARSESGGRAVNEPLSNEYRSLRGQVNDYLVAAAASRVRGPHMLMWWSDALYATGNYRVMLANNLEVHLRAVLLEQGVKLTEFATRLHKLNEALARVRQAMVDAKVAESVIATLLLVYEGAEAVEKITHAVALGVTKLMTAAALLANAGVIITQSTIIKSNVAKLATYMVNLQIAAEGYASVEDMQDALNATVDTVAELTGQSARHEWERAQAARLRAEPPMGQKM